MNKCIFTGRITKELEMKTSQSGTNILGFDIAVQRSYKNNDGEYETDFIRCIAFKNTAEFISKYAKKGYVIQVEGEMRNNNFTRDDGTTNYGMQLVVSSVDSTVLFLNKKNNQENESDTSGYDYGTAKQTQGQNTSYTQPPAGAANNPFANNGPIDISDDDLPF